MNNNTLASSHMTSQKYHPGSSCQRQNARPSVTDSDSDSDTELTSILDSPVLSRSSQNCRHGGGKRKRTVTLTADLEVESLLAGGDNEEECAPEPLAGEEADHRHVLLIPRIMSMELIKFRTAVHSRSLEGSQNY